MFLQCILNCGKIIPRVFGDLVVLTITLFIGDKKVVTAKELEYEDTDSLVFYQIAVEPQFGDISYKTQIMQLGDGFSQADIAAMLIR